MIRSTKAGYNIIAMLFKDGNFPVAYPYPSELRAARDLLLIESFNTLLKKLEWHIEQTVKEHDYHTCIFFAQSRVSSDPCPGHSL